MKPAHETNFPWLSGGFALAALAVWFFPEAGAALQFDRSMIIQGEWWRVVTGHLAHWNGDQLFWNVLPFYVLGALCEGRDRRRFAWCLGLAAGVVPAVVWVYAPWLQYYRGLSGLDSAFFTLLGAMLLREKIGERRWGAVVGIVALWAGFLGKVAFEATQGATLFVENEGGMVPVAAAHLAGAAAGVAAYVIGGRRARESKGAVEGIAVESINVIVPSQGVAHKL